MAAPRKIDYAEARKLRKAGLTYRQIADYLGVSDFTARRACDQQQRARMDQNGYGWHLARRQPCRGGCGTIVWTSTRRDATGFCRTCLARERSATVRPDSLRCGRCGEWKADNEFPFRTDAIARRQRHSFCRRCGAEARLDYRERHKVPCIRCGTPRLSDARCRDSGLCGRCYQTRGSA